MSILKTEPLNPLVDEDNLLDYAKITPRADVNHDTFPVDDKNDNIPPHRDDSSDDEVPPPPSSPPADINSYRITLAETNVPFSGQSRSSKGNVASLDDASHVFDHLTSPGLRASEILHGGKAVNSALNVVTTGTSAKLRKGAINLTKPKIEKKNISTSSSITKRGSTVRGSSYDTKSISRNSSMNSYNADDTDTDSSMSPTKAREIMNSSTGSEDEIPPPPPIPPPVTLPAILADYPVYRRLYSSLHETYYFVDEKTQKSIWEVPELGIVISEDENSKREYYTDCDTGIVAWTLDSLAGKIQELQFS